MTIVEKTPDEARQEIYEKPLLTRHEALHALTGVSSDAPQESVSTNY